VLILQEYIQGVTQKIFCSTGFICKLKPNFPKNILMQLSGGLRFFLERLVQNNWGAPFICGARKNLPPPSM